MSDNDNFGAFLIGFLVGGITGAAVSLLFAPSSGEDTRELIKVKAIELKDKTVVTAEEAYHKAEAAATEAAEKAQEMLKVAQEKAAEVVKKTPVVLEVEKVAPKTQKSA
ncbi:MAG: YtxH domain-containing protein [Anaerolineaceae bacterium]|nr:YtxH domain-containing protein [Anaerolineaceae bacterium]